MIKLKQLFTRGTVVFKKLIVYILLKGGGRILSDRVYLSIMFRIKMGTKLNLDNPRTFSEKLQWLKLYNRNPLYTSLVDKVEVRKYIISVIGEEYLIPIIGVYNEYKDIDFNSLPDCFVLKCTHDSGGVIICSDKNKLNKKKVEKKIKRSLKKNYYYQWREWPYKDIRPRILCEQYLEEVGGEEVKDYKFMCFNGKVKFLMVCSERNSDKGLSIDFYDSQWNKLECYRSKHKHSNKIVEKPKNFEKMIYLSEKIAKDFPFIRVDFYNINGKIYFGELTFYPASGLERFEPNRYDELFGDYLELLNV